MSASPPTLACIGNVCVDELVQPDGGRTVDAGGDCLYAALGARALLPRVRWLAPVGEDLPPDLLEALGSAGLIAGAPDPRPLPTVRHVVREEADGARHWHLVHGEEHFDRMSVHPGEVPDDVLGCDGILVCGMSLSAQLSLGPWLRAATGARIYLDLQEGYLAGNEALLLTLVPTCDVFLPSEVEAVALAGTRDLGQAIRLFAGLGPSVVVIKRGERGCLVLDAASGTVEEVPAERVEPVDATGAGDAFCGAFAAAHLQGASPVESARAGAAAARTCVSGPGLAALLDTARGGVTVP